MANRIYLPPRREIYQGDIYRDFPGIYMEARPFRVARFFKATPERDIYGVHREDAEPSTNRFKWGFGQAGEEILARGHLGMAMVISHDCEIENDKNYRTLAMVRPVRGHVKVRTRGHEKSAPRPG